MACQPRCLCLWPLLLRGAWASLGTYFLKDLLEPARTVGFDARAQGAGSAFGWPEMPGAEAGAYGLRVGDVLGFAFPTRPQATGTVLELQVGYFEVPWRLRLLDAGNRALLDLYWPKDEAEKYEVGFSTMGSVLVSLEGFNTSAFSLELLEFPGRPWRRKYSFAWLGSLVSVWRLDELHAEEGVFVARLPGGDCMATEQYSAFSGEESSLAGGFLQAGAATCSMPVDLAAALSALPSADFVEFNGFKAQNAQGLLQLARSSSMGKEELSSLQLKHYSAVREMGATSWLVPAASFIEGSNYTLELTHFSLSPFVKVRGRGSRGFVLDLTAANVSFSEQVGGGLSFTQSTCRGKNSRLRYGAGAHFVEACYSLRRRRSKSKGPPNIWEGARSMTFELPDLSALRRPFLELVHGSSDSGDVALRLELTDAAGKVLGQGYFPKWSEKSAGTRRNLVSLAGATPGLCTLKVLEGNTWFLYPFISVQDAKSSAAFVAPNAPSPVQLPKPAGSAYGTFELLSLLDWESSFMESSSFMASFPGFMSEVPEQRPGSLGLRLGDVLSFSFPRPPAAQGSVLELNVGQHMHAFRLQLKDGSGRVAMDLLWAKEHSDTLASEGFVSGGSVFVPLDGLDTSSFRLEAQAFPGEPTASKWSFAFVGALVSVWRVNELHEEEQVFLQDLRNGSTLLQQPRFGASAGRNCTLTDFFNLSGWGETLGSSFNGALVHAPWSGCNLPLDLTPALAALENASSVELAWFQEQDGDSKAQIWHVSQDAQSGAWSQNMLYALRGESNDREMVHLGMIVPASHFLAAGFPAGELGTADLWPLALHIKDLTLFPYAKVRGAKAARSLVMDVNEALSASRASLDGQMLTATQSATSDNGMPFYSASAEGGQSLIISNIRRRRRTTEQRWSRLTFAIPEEVSAMRRPFLEFLHVLGDTDGSSGLHLTDSLGRSFGSFDYLRWDDDFGGSRKQQLSLLGVAPGFANLTVIDDYGFALFPFLHFVDVPGPAPTTSSSSSTSSTGTATSTSTSATSSATTTATTTVTGTATTTRTGTTWTGTTATRTGTTATSTATRTTGMATTRTSTVPTATMTAIATTVTTRTAASTAAATTMTATRQGAIGTEMASSTGTRTAMTSTEAAMTGARTTTGIAQTATVALSTTSAATWTATTSRRTAMMARTTATTATAPMASLEATRTATTAMSTVTRTTTSTGTATAETTTMLHLRSPSHMTSFLGFLESKAPKLSQAFLAAALGLSLAF